MASTQQLLLGEGAGGAEKNYIEDVFSTYLYTGTGAAQTITNNIDLAGKGGMVWTKSRSNAISNIVVDSVRGGTNALITNSTAANSADTGYHISSFNSNGYSLQGAGSGDNFSGYTYASWTFRKQPKFFDIVTYTGNGSAGHTISHNLTSTPGAIIVKRTESSSDWNVWHRSATGDVFLNLTDAQDGGRGITDVTDSSFTVGTSELTHLNASGGTYVAYIFAHDAGGFGLTGTESVIKCGSYNWTANTDINLGWEPQFILTKEATGTYGGWRIVDNMRGLYPVATGGQAVLSPNTTSVESASNTGIGITSTGFRTSSDNNSSMQFIYIAIRRGPMKVPTDATKVFTPYKFVSGTTNPDLRASFPVDSFFLKRTTPSEDWYVGDRLRGDYYLATNTTSAEASTGGYFKFDYQNGAVNNFGLTTAYVSHLFRRAPSFFDEVILNSSTSTYTHNLTVAPELIFVKCRDASGANWVVYSKSLSSPTTKYLNLNTTGAEQLYGTGAWSTSATQFSVDTGLWANGSSGVAYLFATCAGVSKVGSYTGTGTTLQVDCGFAAGARFVLIKRTDSTGDWYVWDTARGIVSGNDPYLLLNSTAAEVTSTDYIDTYSAGFEISSTAPAAINASGGTFIFLAIA